MRPTSAGAPPVSARNGRSDGVIVPLDDMATKAGLDLADFSEFSLKMSRYPKYDNKLFMIPMDLMSLQPEVNLDHVKEAGLDPANVPARRRHA